MLTLEEDKLVDILYETSKKAICEYPDDGVKHLYGMLEKETNPISKLYLQFLTENVEIAKREGLPMCQTPGMGFFHYKIGIANPIKIDGDLYEAARRAVRKLSQGGYLRPSIQDIFTGVNTGDCTGRHIPTIDIDFMNGKDYVDIDVMYKGGNPGEGATHILPGKLGRNFEGVQDIVLHYVLNSFVACAPLYVGVGLGATADECMRQARLALMRPYSEEAPDPKVSKLERELTKAINKLDMGCGGLGGNAICFGVHINRADTEVGMLDVAVMFCCHARRVASVRLHSDGTVEDITKW